MQIPWERKSESELVHTVHDSKEMTQPERHSVLRLGSILLQGHSFAFDHKLASQRTALLLDQ